MLRVSFLTLIPFALGGATDDANLMQHGLELASSESASLRSSLAVIQEEMNLIPQPGKMRQMAIDALMKSVSESDKLDEESKGSLAEIMGLLGTILDEEVSENSNDQASLNGSVPLFDNCNTDGVAADAAVKGAWESANISHDSCRELERDLFENETLFCEQLIDYMSKYDEQLGDTCVVPHEDDIDKGTVPLPEDFLADWTKFLSDGANWFDGRYNEMKRRNDNCVAAREKLALWKEDCNTKQGTMENKFCEWASSREALCGQRDTCFASELDAYENMTARIKPVADARVNAARVIEHIKCLLQAIIDGEFNSTNDGTAPNTIQVCKSLTESEEKENEYQNKYNVTYPDLPTKTPCDVSVVAIKPEGPWPEHSEAWRNYAFKKFLTNFSVESPVSNDHKEC